MNFQIKINLVSNKTNKREVRKLTKEEYKKKVIEIIEEFGDDEKMTVSDVVDLIIAIPIPKNKQSEVR